MPIHSQPLHLKVIYFPQEEYRELDFQDFSLSHARELGTVVESGSVETCHRFAAYVQAWLYFALVAKFLGQTVNHAAFQAQTSSQEEVVLNSEHLTSCLNSWSRRIRKSSRSKRKRYLNNALDLLIQAMGYCDELDQPTRAAISEAEVSVLLSVRILLSTLLSAIEMRFHSSGNIHGLRQRLIPGFSTKLAPSAQVLRRHMLESGRCKHQVSQFLSQYDYTTLWYIANLQVGPGGDSEAHVLCTSSYNCRANDIDSSSFQGCHVERRCCCSQIGPLGSEVALMIANGKTPLIAASLRSNGQWGLDLVERSPHHAYTAISHVWSNGLGNALSNKVYICQYQRLLRQLHGLRRLATDDPGNVLYFWLDTFCIPVGGAYATHELKAKAISSMTSIYAEATRVLVLDPAMRAITSSGTSQLELRMHILCSTWMTRCWTTQEAALAASGALYFDWADQATSLPVNLPNVKESGFDWLLDFYLPSQHRIYKDIRRSFLLPPVGCWRQTVYSFDSGDRFQRLGERQIQFLIAWNHLLGRSTTKWEDVHGIFSHLLDFYEGEILGLPQAQRMRALIRGQGDYPIELLCTDVRHPSRKSNGLGNDARWVPEYPAGLPLEYFEWGLGFAELRDAGLFIESLHNFECFLFPTSSQLSFRVSAGARGSTFVALNCDPSDAEPLCKGSVSLLLLHANDGMRMAPKRHWGKGFLLTIIASDTKVLRGVYDCSVVFRASEEHDGAVTEIRTESLTGRESLLVECGRF